MNQCKYYLLSGNRCKRTGAVESEDGDWYCWQHARKLYIKEKVRYELRVTVEIWEPMGEHIVTGQAMLCGASSIPADSGTEEMIGWLAVDSLEDAQNHILKKGGMGDE